MSHSWWRGRYKRKWHLLGRIIGNGEIRTACGNPLVVQESQVVLTPNAGEAVRPAEACPECWRMATNAA